MNYSPNHEPQPQVPDAGERKRRGLRIAGTVLATTIVIGGAVEAGSAFDHPEHHAKITSAQAPQPKNPGTPSATSSEIGHASESKIKSLEVQVNPEAPSFTEPLRLGETVKCFEGLAVLKQGEDTQVMLNPPVRNVGGEIFAATAMSAKSGSEVAIDYKNLKVNSQNMRLVPANGDYANLNNLVKDCTFKKSIKTITGDADGVTHYTTALSTKKHPGAPIDIISATNAKREATGAFAAPLLTEADPDPKIDAYSPDLTPDGLAKAQGDFYYRTIIEKGQIPSGNDHLLVLLPKLIPRS